MQELTRAYLQREYVQNERSLTSIAAETGKNPNTIRRALIKFGYRVRDKSEAQKKALASGRGKHPTAGKQRPNATKERISEGVAASWRKADDTERARRVAEARTRWEKMAPDKQEQFRQAALDGVREAAKTGSKLEKFLLVELQAKGHTVDFHRTHVFGGEQQHVDLLLPDLRTAIEVDGPTHFFPIWGEEDLARRVLADQRKTGLLLGLGYSIIRVKHLTNGLSEIQKRTLLTELLSVLDGRKHKRDAGNQLVELEIK